MKPITKDELRKLVTNTTLEIYEELTPQYVKLLKESQSNPELTDAQRTDEILLDTIGYIKSCTNEIIVEVLSEILDFEDGHSCGCGHDHCHCHEEE